MSFRYQNEGIGYTTKLIELTTIIIIHQHR